MSARTDSTLRITPAEYRQFAEEVKARGMVLRLFEQPAQIIGLRSGLDASVIDATCEEVTGSLVEAPSLLLCTSIDAGLVRREAKDRYECDVSQLTDAEMYRFWLYHEIGHGADNYCSLSYQFSEAANDRETAKRVLDRIWHINEILADRWAWAHVCDRPMPLTETGRRLQDTIAAELDFLDRITGGRKNYATQPFPHIKPGKYHGVPLRMLAREDAHIWVGPDIAPGVKERARELEARAKQDPQNHLPERLISRVQRRAPLDLAHVTVLEVL